jgi:hypothetical protein
MNGFSTCPACFGCYPTLSIHTCTPTPLAVGDVIGQVAKIEYAGATRDPRTERMAFLERKREAVKADLYLKFQDSDWHGVADAAMDLRGIESELKGLAFK